ncbi:MAG: AAA family ATPase [bacterium]|nr:AAA family ATPase [bacterium]
MSERKRVRLDDSKMGPEAEKILKHLTGNVVGQEHALQQVADALEIAFSDFREPRRPMGTFFLLGPSGTGKTETAEQLAKYFFNNPDALLKVECESMAQEHQTAALIGSPPGYVGFQDPEDPTGEHPLLTNWNIYKHHFEMLQEKYDGMLSERSVFSNRISEIKKKRLYLMSRHRDLQNSSNELTEQVYELGEQLGDIFVAIKQIQEDKTAAAEMFIGLNQVYREWKKLGDQNLAEAAEANRILQELIVMQGELKELEAKLEKTDKEYYENGLDWDGSGDVPKNLIGIVLFDELEKAHRNMHHLLYQIIDKGKLKQSNGVLVNFENCIIIATGNVASAEIADVINNKALGFKMNNPKTKNELGEDIYELALEKANEDLPIPLLGRFDSIEVFRPLDTTDMGKIFELQLNLLKSDIAEKGIKITIEIDPAVKDYLVQRAMKRMEWGARLLKQRVRKYVRLKVVRLLITKQLKSGDTVSVVLEDSKKMVFDSLETAA